MQDNNEHKVKGRMLYLISGPLTISPWYPLWLYILTTLSASTCDSEWVLVGAFSYSYIRWNKLLTVKATRSNHAPMTDGSLVINAEQCSLYIVLCGLQCAHKHMYYSLPSLFHFPSCLTLLPRIISQTNILPALKSLSYFGFPPKISVQDKDFSASYLSGDTHQEHI